MSRVIPRIASRRMPQHIDLICKVILNKDTNHSVIAVSPVIVHQRGWGGSGLNVLDTDAIIEGVESISRVKTSTILRAYSSSALALQQRHIGQVICLQYQAQ